MCTEFIKKLFRSRPRITIKYGEPLKELPSPRVRIDPDDIQFDQHRGTLTVQFPVGTKMVDVANTNSMEPLVDEGVKVFMSPISDVFPYRYENLIVGDVIIFNEPGNDVKLIIHPIVEMGQDDVGRFYYTKGLHPDITGDPWLLRDSNVKFIYRGHIT